MTGSVGKAKPEELFGSAVRRAREARGWSQEGLANQIQKHLELSVGGQSGVARIERGERPTRLNEAVLIAKFLNIDLQIVLADATFSEVEKIDMVLAGVKDQLALIKRDLMQAEAEFRNARAVMEEADNRRASLAMRHDELCDAQRRLERVLYQMADAAKRVGMARESDGDR